MPPLGRCTSTLYSDYTACRLPPATEASTYHPVQVYKGTLLDGRQVAVKVQRPSILDEIALDLYVLRIHTPLQTRVSNLINRLPTYPEDIALARQPHCLEPEPWPLTLTL